MNVAVAGGTGMVGRHLVEILANGGHEVVVLARSRGVDVVKGDGLAGALDGVEAVVDVSNVTTTRRQVAVAFFTAATTQLLAAGRLAGVRHHVALSIVGIDRVGSGYYEGKRRQESLLLEDDRSSVLRATQFHEFPSQVLDATRGPVAPVPQMLTQPVAAREVAAALAELAVGDPVGMAPELAGPEQHELVDLARQVVRARGQHRAVVPVRVPGEVGAAMRAGGLLPLGPGPRGTVTFAEWLAATYPPEDSRGS